MSKLTDLPREQMRDLPPSAKLVLFVLRDADDRLTQQELVQQTFLHDRTARWALERLIDDNLVEKSPCLSDARQDYYDTSW